MSIDNLGYIDIINTKQAPENAKFLLESELISGVYKNEKKLSEYLKNYHQIDLNSFDQDTKKRFLEEINILFSDFGGYKSSMIPDLRNIRETMSMGVETGKNDAYYTSMIFSNKIEKRITLLKEILRIKKGEALDETDLKNKKFFDKITTQKGMYIKGFGIDLLGSTLSSGYEKLEKDYADTLLAVENMNEADLVILLRTLFSIIPVAGDLVGGKDDLTQAYAGINADGSIQGVGENLFYYITGSLGVSIVGGKVGTIAKGPIHARAMIKIEQIITKLSSAGSLEKLAKNKNFISFLEHCKGKIPGVEKLLSKLQESKITAKLSNEIMSKMSDEELVTFLMRNNITKLETKDLDSKMLTRLNHILTSNFPLLEIQRLIPGDKLVNINISGIKQINDIAGQEFCDAVIFKFKHILKRGFASRNDALTRKARVVKDDYKNLTFVTDAKDPLKMVFGTTTSKTEIMIEIMKSLEKDIQENARKLIQSQIDKKEIIIKSKYEFETLVTKKASQTQLVVMKYFDFGVGQATIPVSADNVSKLDSIRKAEISSRVGVTKTDAIEIKPFTQKELISHLEVALDTEKMILEKYKNTKFIFDGIAYNVVVQTPSGPALSTELLRYVRKYPDAVKPNELSVIVRNYISNLNGSLDFISPVKHELTPNGKEFQIARDIDRQIRSGTLESKYLLQSYKGGLTKKAFFESTSNKAGTKIFIDIKDMGIDNLVDFNLRAKQILKLDGDLKAGKIDVHTYESLTQKLFLEAGKSVSDKFLEIQKRISKKYPDAIMSFGGDEIFLFIPEKKIQFQKEIEASITQILSASNQKARVVIDVNKDATDTKDSFSKLEQITKLSKMVEETLEKQLTKKGYVLNGNLPDNTYIKIEESTRTKIMKPDFHMDDFFKKVLAQIQNVDLTGNFQKPIVLGQIENGISLSIIKNSKNEIEIYLHN